jgi:hypothetical protein
LQIAQDKAPGPGDCSEATALARLRQQICDALELLCFAATQGKQIDRKTIAAIENSRKFLGSITPDAKASGDFENAYQDLARAMAPVTAETLYATDDRRPGYRRASYTQGLKVSDARLFYWKLAFWAFLGACLVGFLQVLNASYVPDDENVRSVYSWFTLVGKVAAPFLYGFLGAVTYLLRSAQTYISARSFDLRRVPEYSNRMVLGAIAGGIVLLFVDPKSIGFTQDAIALAVGYNTDALFSLLERVGNAVTNAPIGTVTPAPTSPAPTPAPAPQGPADGAPAGPAIASCAVASSKKPPAGSKGFVALTLNAAAPAAGAQVNLASTPADAVTFTPPAVTVSAGATTANAMFTISSTAHGQVTLTATGGDATASDQIDVQ